eukprot:CAMPEP_0171916984 /NCGR_PEP_ID=MMETSP0993-20121228/15493_1 /TAXON_ID=483369 /ORGANISM="non described non described, Strain CCMP2098" /LENGTH=265 /DNA_ID=CAMNT_0012552647 /DNA_START=755 /DNA_END=1555 /DNA_ORIENTATION=-
MTPQSTVQPLCSAASTNLLRPSIGGSGENLILRSAKVHSQPGDGSCLFHSLAVGINGSDGVECSAGSLRRQISECIKNNPNLEIAGTPKKDWVKWDSGTSVSTYADRISHGGWGGGIEMAVCSSIENVNVHVYECPQKRSAGGGGFKRISCFDVSGGGTKTVHVLYRGGVHYDALVPTETVTTPAATATALSAHRQLTPRSAGRWQAKQKRRAKQKQKRRQHNKLERAANRSVAASSDALKSLLSTRRQPLPTTAANRPMSSTRR